MAKCSYSINLEIYYLSVVAYYCSWQFCFSLALLRVSGKWRYQRGWKSEHKAIVANLEVNNVTICIFLLEMPPSLLWDLETYTKLVWKIVYIMLLENDT